ncbi:MAG: hypothetical protein IPH11_15985 [Ignavibacteriales bacterium]|nr:hypothetical protein [Ignavibacteriales bacterium]
MKILFLGRYEQSEILNGPEKVAKRIFTGLQDKTESVFIEYFFDGSKYSIWKNCSDWKTWNSQREIKF